VLLLLLGIGAGAACSSAPLPIADIERMEVYETKESVEPAVVLEGAELRRLLGSGRCHDRSYLWKGGYPAVFVTKRGARRASRGLSAYGRFLVLPGGIICEYDGATWGELHGERPAE
jgi:hypothetical protein